MTDSISSLGIESFSDPVECIQAQRSFVFDAGAGSGKTHKLVECLRFIQAKDWNRLENAGQGIACITYTNVAAGEIRERIGESDIISVSTIHDFLWARMKRFKQELRELHREKIREELDSLNLRLETGEDCKSYSTLDSDARNRFRVWLDANKSDVLSCVYSDLRAADFRLTMQDISKNEPLVQPMMKNVSNFKAIVKMLNKCERYERCLENWTEEELNVEYDPLVNYDQLVKGKFSHDTLLEYAKRMVENNSGFALYLLSLFPFIMVDEYQDTNPCVVELLLLVREFAMATDRPFLVGFFGDCAQNIYEKGVGTIQDESLVKCQATRNWRSAKSIVDVANKVRHDNLKQEPVREDSKACSVEFFCFTKESIEPGDVKAFIASRADEWQVEVEELDCLMLSHKQVADCMGFNDYYTAVSNLLPYFELTSGFLGKEPEKLHSGIRIFYNIARLRNILKYLESPISRIFPRSYIERTDIALLKKIVASLLGAKGHTIASYLDSLRTCLQESVSNEELIVDVYEICFGMDEVEREGFLRLLVDRFDRLSYVDSLVSEALKKFLKAVDSEKLEDADLRTYRILKKLLEKVDIDDSEDIDFEAYETINALLEKVDIDDLEAIDSASYEMIKMTLADIKVDDLEGIDMGIYETLKKLLRRVDVDKLEDINSEIYAATRKLLEEIDIEELDAWYEYLSDEHREGTQYHTFHGVKGAEYDNVIIVASNKFNPSSMRSRKSGIDEYFKCWHSEVPFNGEEDETVIAARNLLYVAVTRAKQHEAILYLDDISPYKDAIESIFDRVSYYPEERVDSSR